MATNIMITLILLMVVASIKAHTHRHSVASKRCTIELENINLAPGEEQPSKIKCSMYSCIKNGTGTTLKIKSCVLRPLQAGCYYSEESLPKPFPQCCPVMICDPHFKEDFFNRYEVDQTISQDDVEFKLTDLNDYSGVIESYEMHQRGASECTDSTGNIAIQAGQHYEDKKRCIYYSCIPSGNNLRLRVASCFHEPPGPGCHRTPINPSKTFPKCCPVTMCKEGFKNQTHFVSQDSSKSPSNRKSSHKCYIWNQHLALSQSAQVQINGGCGLYTCLGHGKLQISGCIKTTLPPGCIYTKPDVSKPFPQCCPIIVCPRKIQEKVTELPVKCIVKQENLFLSLGQTIKSNSQCALYTCLSCGKLKISSCEVQPLISGCQYSVADSTKPFPECCPEMICDTHTKQQVIEQVHPKDPHIHGVGNVEENIEDKNPQTFLENRYINKTTGKCSVAQANKDLKAEGICGRYFCVQSTSAQRIIFSRCSAKPAQPHCMYYKGDMNQQFPRCCPVTVCRNLEVQTGQHVILGNDIADDLEITTNYNLDAKKPGSSDNSGICSYPNEKIKLKIGRQLILPGKCLQYVCKWHGISPRLEISSCVKQPLPAGCHYTGENFMKPFPECCPIVICMTLQQKEGNLRFPYIFRPDKKLIKEADINIDASGSHTINTDILAQSRRSEIMPSSCYYPEHNLNIPVGATINSKDKCLQYSCVIDGNSLKLHVASCNRKPLPPGCFEVANDINKEFPHCCPVIKCQVSPTKCIHPEENISLMEGQEINLNSSCAQYSCIRVGKDLKLRKRSCDKTTPPPPGCYYTKADKTKPFPECCSSIMCYSFVSGSRRTLNDLSGPISQLDPANIKTKIDHSKLYFKKKYRERRHVDVIAETSGKCYVWKENVKLSIGEQIKAKGQCLLHSCISQGDKTLLKTYSCTYNVLQPGCSYSAGDLAMPFPDCCPIMTCHKNETQIFPKPKETAGKCYHPEKNLILTPGSVTYGKQNCERYTCSSRGVIFHLKTESCMPKIHSPGCTYKNGDLSKQFPDCCPLKECVNES